MNFQMFDVSGQRSERRKWIRLGFQQHVLKHRNQKLDRFTNHMTIFKRSSFKELWVYNFDWWNWTIQMFQRSESRHFSLRLVRLRSQSFRGHDQEQVNPKFCSFKKLVNSNGQDMTYLGILSVPEIEGYKEVSTRRGRFFQSKIFFS